MTPIKRATKTRGVRFHRGPYATDCVDKDGRNSGVLVVRLLPSHLEIWIKGTRSKHTVSWVGVADLARRRTAARIRMEKLNARKAKRRR